jgi:hypothetical protein
MVSDKKARDCPYCKEQIKTEATKCKYCGSAVSIEKPPHEGICPHCKEQIHNDAIKCKHCHSILVSSRSSHFGDSYDGRMGTSMLKQSTAKMRALPERTAHFPGRGISSFSRAGRNSQNARGPIVINDTCRVIDFGCNCEAYDDYGATCTRIRHYYIWDAFRNDNDDWQIECVFDRAEEEGCAQEKF